MVALSAVVALPLALGLTAAGLAAPGRQERAERAVVEAVAQSADADVAAFYGAAGARPLWVAGDRLRPQAGALVAVLETAYEDGLDPRTYHPEDLKAKIAAARPGDVRRLAAAEAALSIAYASYVHDLHRPAPGAAMVYTSGATPPDSPSRLAALRQAAGAPSIPTRLDAARRMNPIYERFRSALIAYRRDSGLKDHSAADEAVLLENLERARALPADLGERFVLVNAASATLWLYDHGRAVRSMRVVVGAPETPTPVMAGMIRYAVFNPVWNVPEDLVRTRVAPAVLRKGMRYFEGEHLEVLSDWSDEAVAIDPTTIDWQAVAAGRLTLRVRQRPGPDNMMGKVKLMLPNPLGVYLHDTPNKALLRSPRRTFSAGCVRLEDAGAAAAWLLGRSPDTPRAETRVDLPAPVPVYIAYFTAWPDGSGVSRPEDVYHRDAPLLAQMQRDPSRLGANLQLAAAATAAP